MINRDTQALHHEPVYARLDWIWAWRGISLVHIGFCLLPAFFFCMLAWIVQETLWSGCPMALGLLPSVGLMVFVSCLQYRQAPGHLLRQMLRLNRPIHLSPLRKHPHETPVRIKEGRS